MQLIFKILSILFLLISCGSYGGTPPIVKTQLGEIKGVYRSGAYEYRGIPYSAPLNSADRWTLAQPVRSWEGTINAVNFSGACPQTRRFELTEESLTENCLTLNISTPTDMRSNEKLPVIVWIPGGGFVGGSSNLYRLDKLAREGRIIVVSINYRVGALGFMAHPSITNGWNGNLGLEDQRLALQWVQDNISAFGGDVSKVTLAGESAGAASTCLHILSKTKTTGLFQQALPLSYNCLYEWPTLNTSLTQSPIGGAPSWSRLTAKLDCIDPGHSSPTGSANELNCLRSKPIKDLLSKQDEIASEVPLFPFAPVINSGINGTIPLPDYSASNLRNNLNKVPTLYGGAKDELRLYVGYDVLNKMKNLPTLNTANLQSDFVEQELRLYYGIFPSDPIPNGMNNAIATYFGTGPISADGLGSMFSDYTPVVGLNNCTYLKTAKFFSDEGVNLFQWEFADPNAPVLGVGIAKGLDPKMQLGAVHSAALNYIFPNLSNTSAIDAPDLAPESQTLSNRMVQVWANFVKTGNPQTTHTSNWQPYKQPSNNVRVMKFIPGNIHMYDARAAHQCAFWEGVDSSLLGPN